MARPLSISFRLREVGHVCKCVCVSVVTWSEGQRIVVACGCFFIICFEQGGLIVEQDLPQLCCAETLTEITIADFDINMLTQFENQ